MRSRVSSWVSEPDSFRCDRRIRLFPAVRDRLDRYEDHECRGEKARNDLRYVEVGRIGRGGASPPPVQESAEQQRRDQEWDPDCGAQSDEGSEGTDDHRGHGPDGDEPYVLP